MERTIKKTGGQVDNLVFAIVDAAFDKKVEVRDDMISALHTLGKQQAELVLSTCVHYLNKHQKLVQGHRVLILDVMTKVIKDAGVNVSLELAKELIVLATNELTKSKDIIPEWQLAASNVLVALGVNFCQEVMIEMLQKVTPGQLPHYFVILTLANLAKENVFGVVPFLKDIFSRMLSMLGTVKADNMRWVLAKCIGSFSEAIIEYCANIENAPYPDIAKDRFYGEIFTAFEIMFSVWLGSSREGRVRLAVIEAFGYMCHLMTKEKLEEYIQRLLHGITGLYRRHSEHHILTQSLCLILNAASCDRSLMLLPLLDLIMNGLHAQACSETDLSNPLGMKNKNEVLRCFQVLTQNFPDRVVGFLQLKLENVNDKSRAATLAIIKHIINSSDEYLESKRELLLSTVKVVLYDHNLKVCKSFSQCIIAMAHHRYLLLEGGQSLVEFIIRMCSLKEEDKIFKRIVESEDATWSSIKLMNENILQLMATTIENMEDILWPYLVEFVLPVNYTEAIMALCRALTFLANRKQENKDSKFSIQPSNNTSIPKPQALLARLIVLTGHPLKGNGRGLHILSFLKAYSLNISPEIVQMWDVVIPKLTLYLEENSCDVDNWNQKAWEDLILKLLAKTLSEINSEDWYLTLGQEMGTQISLYNGFPDDKNFLYKCLGVILRKIGTTEFIREHLNIIFSTVDHNNQIEREGCAVGVGFCAASHLDQCLMKLEEITKTQMVRKASGFMGLIKDKSEAEVEKVKSTVMLCYGYVVFYGPSGLVSARLESNILRVINPHFASTKDSVAKQNLIKAVELIGKAVQPSHMQQDGFVFTRRGDLLKHMQAFLKSEPQNASTECRSMAIDAITNLVKLEPPLSEADLLNIINVCASNVYPVVPKSPENQKSRDNSLSENDGDINTKNAVQSMNTLMCEVSSRDSSPGTLQNMIKILEPYTTSVHNHEREQVMQTVRDILSNFLAITNFQSGVHFSTLGNILGRLLPRCTDPVVSVRQNSVECVQILLTINDRYEGVPANVNDERIEALTQLRENLLHNEPALLFTVVNELSIVISKKVPDEQVKTLVFSLIEGLRDVHSQSSSGACAILNCLIKFRGSEMNKEVPAVIQAIVSNLSMVSFAQTTTGSLVAMRTLASHHLIQVLQTFLEFPVPFNNILCDFWKTLARDKELASDTFEHLLDILLHSLPYTEHEDPCDESKTIRIAAHLPIAISSALTEIFKVPETEKLVTDMFPKLLSAILIRLGSTVDVLSDLKGQKKKNLPSPMSCSIECLKEFIERSKCVLLKQHMDEQNAWEKFENVETFTDGIQVVAIGICKYHSSCVNDLVSALLPSLSSLYDYQRVVPAAIFSELINESCCGDMQLVELLMNSLLSKLVDPSHVVRKLCIRGLGNVASVGGQKLQTYSTTILSAMMAGMDDKEDPQMSITLEAMSGLSKILSLLDESSVRQILINICLRIRPCFEKEISAVRAAAISLFGNLARFGKGPSESAFLEQIHTNFISLLLHLHEEDEVTKASKAALRKIGAKLNSVSINEMFQKHLIEDGNLHYGEFINDLSRLIIADHVDKMNFYVMGCVSFFKSNWPEIRANAALFIGFLLGNLKKNQRETISIEHICSALVVLIKDPSPLVRSRAAEAISLLYDY
ncbi:maestro heat-like repeat-containing protein family member 1 isoform X1 [Hydra vulgaris]|uniref:maestro heat-like repeat-containing protein family member 1 isoform X1 n=1 Tax=Hydra vulgaris TaxID=6087 RepID=UPI001F5E3CAE|nr:maestro heat-like repeat-containing protein family member 1 [Hydra vulgaris]